MRKYICYMDSSQKTVQALFTFKLGPKLLLTDGLHFYSSSSLLHWLFLIKLRSKLVQGTLVPKLTLGSFLTLSVRNGHKLKDWVFRIPAHIESKSR